MSRLSKNIIYNVFGQGLLMVLGFAAVKHIFKQLGEDVLGIVYFTLMMNTLAAAILNMGICSTTVREVSAHAETARGYIKDLIRTFSLFYWGIYFVLGIAVYFLSPIIVQKWINVKTINTETAVYVLRVLGVGALVALPKSLYSSLFQGLQRMEVNNIIDVATTGLQQLGTVLLLIFGGGLYAVVYWFTFCYILRILFYLSFSALFFSWRALVPGYYHYVVKRNLSFASNMMYISILGCIHMNADKVIISKLLPIGEVGCYSVAYNSVSKAALLTRAVSQAAFPSFSALFKSGDKTSLTTQYQKVQDLVCFTTVPIFALIPYGVLPIFSYVFNDEVAWQLLLPTTLLSLGFFMSSTLHIPYVFSLAAGKPAITVRLNFYALFTVLPLTAFLIYNLGLFGAGLSWMFYQFFAYLYAMPRICSECLHIAVWKWYTHVGKFLIIAALVYCTSWVILQRNGLLDIYSLAAGYVVSSASYLICAYFLISEDLRAVLLKNLHRAAHRYVFSKSTAFMQ